MEARQLRHFVAIADCGTFTAAAQRLHISQPGLSASIQVLERSVGATLFVRSKKRAELTDSGRELYAGARRVLAIMDALENQIRDGTGISRSTLRIGAAPSFAGLDLAALISRFTAQNPNVEVSITVGMPLSLLAEVVNETVELAFVTMPLKPPKGVQLTPLSTYPMVLACPHGHRLADRNAVQLSELADETFVEFHADQTPRQIVDHAFAAAGINRSVCVSCNDIGSLLELVAHGLGIAIVPRHCAIATRVPVALVPIDNASLVWTVAVATPLGGVRSDGGQAMWNLIAANARPITVA